MAYVLQSAIEEPLDVEDVSGSDSDSDRQTSDDQDRCLRLPRNAARAALLAGVLGGVALAFVLMGSSSKATSILRPTAEIIGLQEAASPISEAAVDSKLSDLAKQFASEARRYDPESGMGQQMQQLTQMVQNAQKKVEQVRPEQSAVVVPTLNPADEALAPQEQLNDGNRCDDDEEEYPKTGGTCFKKCALLSGGGYPIRTSPFSCCQSSPCNVKNQMVHKGFCSGFDVAGDVEGGGCPEPEGACLEDEEIFDGTCFKKCSNFERNIAGMYFHRVAPTICCNTKGLQCFLPQNMHIGSDFNSGGGIGAGDSYRAPHPPLAALTER
mmetsp:Transcript_21092/g.37195  ORF Transcript_21092/g.37195 Transcript_21092/m.37195 type:complete len:325 (-) Transcript_21092:154-1128(-)